jgi:hypothetical protein
LLIIGLITVRYYSVDDKWDYDNEYKVIILFVETFEVYIEVLLQHAPGETEDIHGKSVKMVFVAADFRTGPPDSYARTVATTP